MTNSEKCPKCEAELCSCDYCKTEGKSDPFHSFLCGTEINNEGNIIEYSWACKKIAELKALLGEAKEFVADKAVDYYTGRIDNENVLCCAECHYRKDRGHRSENCAVALAQSLLTRIGEKVG